ncbi:MAG TPA: hypothetical protein VNX18_04075 [Bryobacteraceae bacterium]|jgi:hypothetical protein|nr:hypothetical protein [Bryobacteraceae bacterium]
MRAAIALLILPLGAMDLRNATIVAPSTLPSPERKAAAMLSDEIAKRTRIRIPVAERAGSGPAILMGHEPKEVRLLPAVPGADGYRVQTLGNTIFVAGNDARGTLFGAGALLRHLHMDRDVIEAPDNLALASAPKYPLRGHQLGYRPKTNSYDGWDVAQWEQYIRDLAVFGTNAIELIPPRSDDAADSPHFPLPPMQMMIEMSRLANEYGLDVWIWYPAMDKDYSDPKTVEFALKEWGDVFRQLPRVDAVFVPGGDPGHTQPKYLMSLLEKQTANLHRYHPKAQIWVSPQSFNREWMDEFLGILKNDDPKWLSGIVFGPQIRMSLPDLRAAVPKRFPIRHYPDITHSRQSQYPVPDWDVAYAVTEAREVINPRPVGEAAIFRATAPYTNGFVTYSEGCNDDVNKIVWSALGWSPEADIMQIVREYARYFIGYRYADSFASGLIMLEQNWRGPLMANSHVASTLGDFKSMERAVPPSVLANWRFQQALYRAYYDAYTRARLVYERELEAKAMDELRRAKRDGSLVVMDRASKILERATDRTEVELRARVFELAEALFQSVRMQLSVPRFKAISTDRGASLDTIDNPVNSRGWLESRFAEIRKLESEAERIQELELIINWEDPGPGGFYDDLGNPLRQIHLVRGKNYAQDPAFLESPLVGFSYRPALRSSWWTHAESLIDAPLRMHYEKLDPNAEYKIRVVYAGDSPNVKIRLVADGYEIHPLIQKPNPVKPVEFDIPKAATANGELNLEWTREQGLGGNGRGCQVSEIWLIKK